MSLLPRFTNVAAKQRGSMLIESLVGVLIMAIIGGGIMHTTARMLNAQRDNAVANATISQLRPQIMSEGVNLCGTTITDVSVNCVTKNITINGKSINMAQPVQLTVTRDGLGEISIGRKDTDE